MSRRILIGLDGSAYSASAVELCIGWARKTQALLVGLGIVDEAGIHHAEAVPLGAGAFKEHRDEVMVGRATRRVEQFLGQFTVRCAEAQVSCKVLEAVGDPLEQILLEAQRYDLLVLGQQTYFHFATQDSADNTLHKILKDAPRPVVVVPEKRAEGPSVVVAYDGSMQAARALQAFVAARVEAAAPVHIVSVAAEHADASRHAERAADFLAGHDITATVHALEDDRSAAAVLLGLAQQLQAGLLVMGAYGKSALRDFFLGSVTRSILEEAKLPLFLYH